MLLFRGLWRLRSLTWLLSAALATTPLSVAAQQSIGLLRDGETEEVLRTFTRPIFEAAGLDADGVKIYLVNDQRINAFVAGGQRVFIHTGLILESDHPGQLIGVIAHETGHIMGAHLLRAGEAIGSASTTAILGMLLGVGAILAGADQAGLAAMTAGQSIAQGQILAYSRSQEAQADQAAITIMDRAGYSSEGLVEFFGVLARGETFIADRINPYMITHPLSRERISLLSERVNQSPYTGQGWSEEWVAMFDRVRGKLAGFIWPTARTLQQYPPEDQSVGARYARAYAYHKVSLLDPAMAEIDSLIADHPDDPWFHELKGQVYFEHGRLWESIAAYYDAVRLAPRQSMLRTSLGQVMLETEDADLVEPAVEHLEAAVRYERDNGSAWYHLAAGYDRSNRPGMASLATAERILLQGNVQEAAIHANRARDRLDDDTPSWLRAQDIVVAARNAMEDRRN